MSDTSSAVIHGDNGALLLNCWSRMEVFAEMEGRGSEKDTKRGAGRRRNGPACVRLRFGGPSHLPRCGLARLGCFKTECEPLRSLAPTREGTLQLGKARVPPLARVRQFRADPALNRSRPSFSSLHRNGLRFATSFFVPAVSASRTPNPSTAVLLVRSFQSRRLRTWMASTCKKLLA